MRGAFKLGLGGLFGFMAVKELKLAPEPLPVLPEPVLEPEAEKALPIEPWGKVTYPNPVPLWSSSSIGYVRTYTYTGSGSQSFDPPVYTWGNTTNTAWNTTFTYEEI
jgi:hypothetical protein